MKIVGQGLEKLSLQGQKTEFFTKTTRTPRAIEQQVYSVDREKSPHCSVKVPSYSFMSLHKKPRKTDQIAHRQYHHLAFPDYAGT